MPSEMTSTPRRPRTPSALPALLSAVLLAPLLAAAADAAEGPKQKARGRGAAADPYADYVWPPPPDSPRIRLEAVLSSRADVEGESKLAKLLIGASPKGPWDELAKPFAVAFDREGRILVTDWQTGALVRVDLAARKWDILGTTGAVTLEHPMGLDVGPDGTIFVADGGRKQVLAFDGGGKLVRAYGRAGELVNPTDAALSPDGERLYVADSKAHRIVLFDALTAERVGAFGEKGEGPGQFAFPTSLAFAPGGELYVVDQINSRVQVLTAAGDFVDSIGRLGVGFGNLVRPKDVAVDEVGFVYVSDNAFNNFQIFDVDFSLLTFVGSGGSGPGRFQGLSGIDVQNERIVAVDQIGHRIQLFRFVVPKNAE